MAYGITQNPTDKFSGKAPYGGETNRVTFGLNQKCYLQNVVFSDKATTDKGKEISPNIEFSFLVGNSIINRRFYAIDKVYSVNRELLTDTSSAAYKKAKDFQEQRLCAAVNHIAAAYLGWDKVNQLLADCPDNFAKYAHRIVGMLESYPNFRQEPVDLFLRYPWNPRPDGAKFLELPDSIGQGLFICKHVPGIFTPRQSNNMLVYVNEEGVEHPFKRGEFFLNSNFSRKGNLGGESAVPPPPTDKMPF